MDMVGIGAQTKKVIWYHGSMIPYDFADYKHL
jgi:hypothetical protein